MFVSDCVERELHASLSMELHGNLSPTLIQDFYLYGLTAILFKNNSLMIHEPIILSDNVHIFL